MEMQMLKCYTYEILIAILQFQSDDKWGGEQTHLWEKMPVYGAARRHKACG